MRAGKALFEFRTTARASSLRTRGRGASGEWGDCSVASKPFPSHKVARKRDPRCSPRGGTRFCASAVEHEKKTGTPLAVFHGGGHRGKQGKTSMFSVFPKDARSSPQRADRPPPAGVTMAPSPPGWDANGLRGRRARWFAIGRGNRHVLPERERGGGESGCSISGRRRGRHRHAGGASGEGGGFPAVSRAHGRAEARPSRGALHGEGHASACPQWKQLARQRGPELPARQRRAKVR